MKTEYPTQLLGYVSRLAMDKQCASFILMDEYVFSTYFAALLQGIRQDSSDDVALGKILSQVIPKFDLVDFEPLADRMGLDKQEKLMQIVNNLRAQFSENITTTYVKDFFLATAIYQEINTAYRSSSDAADALARIVEMMTEIMKAELAGKVTSITHNLRRIMDVIKLSEAEARLIEMNLLFSIDVRSSIFRDFLFTVTKNPQMFEYFYKTMLGDDLIDGTDDDVDDAFSEYSKPIALGIVNYDTKSKRMSNMSEFWVYAISGYALNDDKFFERFVEPLTEKKKTFSGAIAKAAPTDEDLMKEFLGKAYSIMIDHDPVKASDEEKDEAAGLNLMIYGSGRLDKLGYVTAFLDKLEIKGMKVRTRDAKSADIPSITYIAQQRVKKLSETYPIILVVEKAEQALTKNRYRPSWMLDMFEGELDGKKEELDSDEMLLIKNPVPSIWLVDSPGRITSDNVGRFLFHVELKGGSRGDRRVEVQKVVDELGFSPEVAAKLAKYYELNVEQIKSASRTIQMLEHTGTQGENNLLHLIGNSQRALDREKMEELRDSVTKYSLEYLNLGGNVPIEKVVAALKRKQSGNMCLYGPPGTGKTQLAEFIATELDKPLLIKPASALLDKYLGETEKRIAEMFDEAKSEGSILLLDEADSFLRDRALASKSWEVTQVNELLQRMERFQGIFICATNLFQSLDAAALRRFTFKLEFKALRPDQRWKMLINESGVDLDALPDDERRCIEIELGNIKHLTPGDFATVRRQANLLDEIDLDVYTWIERLNIESKAKMLGLERNGMGFIPAGSETTPRDK